MVLLFYVLVHTAWREDGDFGVAFTGCFKRFFWRERRLDGNGVIFWMVLLFYVLVFFLGFLREF